MNISIDQVAALLSAIAGGRHQETQPQPTGPKVAGQHLVVLDRGFVYVGEVEEYPDRVVIRNAKNIRYWGTTNGLGELTSGPTSKTKLDQVGDVIVYRRAVISLIPCQGF